MTREEALEKIRKCLALAASPEQHEAAAALRQAQKLMAQFNLSEADVSLADVSEKRQQAQNVPLVNWEAALASLVASAFGCERYTSQIFKLGSDLKARRRRVFVFVGVGAAPEVAAFAFDVLSRQCAKDRRRHIGQQSKNCKTKTKVARGDLYAEGWIAGVEGKLERFAGRESESALIAQYMAQRHPTMQSADVKSRIKGKNITHNDWQQGLQAGTRAELNHGVPGRAVQPLLTG